MSSFWFFSSMILFTESGLCEKLYSDLTNPNMLYFSNGKGRVYSSIEDVVQDKTKYDAIKVCLLRDVNLFLVLILVVFVLP